MHQPTAHNLKPAGMTAYPTTLTEAVYALHIHLCRRLGKRKVRGAKSDLQFFFKKPLQKVCHENGKNALTRWRVLSRESDSTLMELTPITGRSHQLRIHMREIGHPILGCDFYAPEAALQAAPRSHC